MNGNVAPEMLKPVPVTEAALIVTAVVPVEVNVTDCVAGVFRFTDPKAMVVAFTLKVAVPELVTLIADCPVTFVEPDCVDVAIQDPVPVPDGVNTPAGVIVPPVAVQVTPEANAPVPFTVAEQVAVCDVLIADGLATTAMLVTAGPGAVTVIAAWPATVV